MKYVITGSLGNISLPVTKKLIAAGHEVTVISSSPEKQAAIEALGAKAAIGSIEDRDFLTRTFKGADAVYLMIPPNWVAEDFPAYQRTVSDNYAAAVKAGNIKHVVQLSSIGAHLRNGAGPIDGLGYLEEQLEKLEGTNLLLLRPSYFYTNFFTMTGLIKEAGIMGSNFGASNEKVVLVHPHDIADAAAEHLLKLDFTGKVMRYVSSDEKTPSEIAAVIGQAIGKPGLPWIEFKDEDARQAMLQSGLKDTMASGYVQMGQSFRSGRAQEDYVKQQAAPTGKIKLEDFAKEFAAAYNEA